MSKRPVARSVAGEPIRAAALPATRLPTDWPLFVGEPAPPPQAYALLTELGDYLLTESNDRILLDSA